MKKILQRFYMALIFVFLYAPIVVLMVQSFNVSKSRSKWGGFTFQWYAKLFDSREIMQAAWNTITIALLSSFIAAIIALVACLAMTRMNKRTRLLLNGAANIPMLNADIVTGISLMLLFLSFGIRFGYGTILISHITFNIPYVILCIAPRLSNMNISTYEAALDLGASPAYAFFHVVLPDLFPGILSGFLIAFTMSIDDFIITHFTKGAGIDTLSTKIYTEIKKGIRPEIYALSTIIFLSVIVLILLSGRLGRVSGKRKAAKSSV